MSKDFVEKLKSRLDIVEVLSGYISLKRAGNNYKALCPFHNEKTPSFIVSPDKQFFYCFGCGAGGDAVGFVMKYESLGFSEAVRSLAEKAGLDPGEFSPGQGGTFDRKRLLELLRAAAGFYSWNLEHAPAAKDYFYKRAVNAESVDKFALGYAPPGWDALSSHLKGKGFDEELIISSGICRKSRGQGRGLFDMLRDRVIFPIREAGGHTIAFGGRIIKPANTAPQKDASAGGDTQPKYLNTADSPVFRKGETLYGLDLAREAIRKKGYLVLCEGYLDVIICHQYGFENTAAPLGTAFGPAHLRKLKRQTNRLVLLFDGDQAGLNAAKRAIGLALEQDFHVKVALLPAGFDPDTLLREKGPLAFRKILGASLTPVAFILKTTKGPRVDVIREALLLFHRIQDGIAREEFIRELSETGKMQETAIRQEIKRQGVGFAPEAPSGGALNGPAEFRYNEETLLLSVFMNMPEKRQKILADTNGFQAVEDPDPAVLGLITRVKNGQVLAMGEGEAGDVSGELSGREQSLLARVSITPGFSPEEADLTIEGCVKKLRLRAIEKKISEASGDVNLLRELYRDKEAIKGGNRT